MLIPRFSFMLEIVVLNYSLMLQIFNKKDPQKTFAATQKLPQRLNRAPASHCQPITMQSLSYD